VDAQVALRRTLSWDQRENRNIVGFVELCQEGIEKVQCTEGTLV
jgi:hypothetical protein